MALTLTSESTGHNINMINLSKVGSGQSIDLSKSNPELTHIVLKLVWEGDLDLDASLMLLGADGKTYHKNEKFGVWYGNLKSSGITHSGDLRSGGTEEIVIKKNELDKDIASLVLIASSHHETMPKTIGQAVKPVVYLINGDTGDALYEFSLSNNTTTTCVELVKIDNNVQEFKVTNLDNTLGVHPKGLQGGLDKYV